MNDDFPMQYSLARLQTELEIAIEEYREAFGDSTGTVLLSRATEADDAYKKKGFSEEEKARRLAETAVWARRESEINATDLTRLFGVVGTVSESSYENGYVLATLLHAGAIGFADISLRIQAALVAGESAANFDHLRESTAAYRDAVVSVRLLARFFNLDGVFKIDTDALAENEVQTVRAWKAAVPDNPGSPLDLAGPDPAAELLEDVIWNTDFGEGKSGLIMQSDAFARLVIRLEHWVELQQGDPQALAKTWEHMLAKGLSIAGLDPAERARALSRCAGTCADALLETGSPDAAVSLYDQSLGYLGRDAGPNAFHQQINRAFSLYLADRPTEARQSFSEIDRKTLQELAGFILTLKSEWARYLALAQVLDVPIEGVSTEELTEELIEDVSRMLVGSSDGRVGYLRNLFVGEFNRDIAAIRALGSERSVGGRG